MPKKTSTIIVTTPKERKLPKHFRFLVGTRVAIRWQDGQSKAVYIGVIEEVTDRSAIARAYATVRVDEYRWNGIAHFLLKTGAGISGDEAYKFEVATPEDEALAKQQIIEEKGAYWNQKGHDMGKNVAQRKAAIALIQGYEDYDRMDGERLQKIAEIIKEQIARDERNRY